jgi:hypothetical protein
LIEFLQRHACDWIRFQLGIAPKRLGYPLVFVVENRWKGSKQVSGQDRPFFFR